MKIYTQVIRINAITKSNEQNLQKDKDKEKESNKSKNKKLKEIRELESITALIKE